MAASPSRSYSSTVMRYTSGAASRDGGVFTLVLVDATVAMSGLLESDGPEVGKMSILHPDRQDSSEYNLWLAGRERGRQVLAVDHPGVIQQRLRVLVPAE